jgi:hypothetical protein
MAKRKKLAKVGEYRTVVPKEGVYIHFRKKPSGEMGAKYLRRTEEHAEETGKPEIQKLSQVRVKQHPRKLRSGRIVPVKNHLRDYRIKIMRRMNETEKRRIEKLKKRFGIK